MKLIENRQQILLGLKKKKTLTEKQKKQKGKCVCICTGKYVFSCFIKNIAAKSLELTMRNTKIHK